MEKLPVTAKNIEKCSISRPRLLVFGCGYLGIRVALNAVSAGHVVWATTRRANRARELESAGVRPLIADWNDPRTLAHLPPVDRVLVSVSYDRGGGRSRFESQVGGFRRLLSVMPPETNMCYISTTGVYHQTGGLWVDETSSTRPDREGGKSHLWAEGLLHRNRPASPWTILRLAGIYGPGRVPRAADVIAGRPILAAEQGNLNLVHVDDAAAAVDASWQAKKRLYVVADGCPVVRGEFYREIARQCSVRPPTFEPSPPDARVSMRSDSNKRVWNRRMKRELLPRLRFPTYRAGLSDVLSGNGKRGQVPKV
jgi:nucleoside-diphosphate-sugar epimerase